MSRRSCFAAIVCWAMLEACGGDAGGGAGTGPAAGGALGAAGAEDTPTAGPSVGGEPNAGVSSGGDGSFESGGQGENAGQPATAGAADAAGSAGAAGAAPTCRESAATTLSHGSGRTTGPSAAWLGSDYAVVWSDNRDQNTEIYFAHVDENGKHLGTDLRLTNDPADSVTPSLAWTGSELGVVWVDKRDGNNEIYFTVLDRNGQRKGAGLTDIRVTNDANRSEFPRLVWTGQEYALTWTDTRDGAFDVYFAKLSRAGVKTTADVHVALGASSDIAAAPNAFGVVYNGSRNNSGLQIVFTLLDSNGKVLGADQLLSMLPDHGGNASIRYAGDRFGVAWQGNPGLGGEVQALTLSAAGVVSGTAKPVSQSGSSVTAPSLQADHGAFAVAWNQARSGADDVSFVTLDAQAHPSGAELPVTSDATSSTAPSLVVSDSGYAAAWVDSASDTTGSVKFRKFCAH